MAKKDTLSGFSEKLLQGAGLGSGKDYRPWLDARTTASHGVCSQIPGIKTGRIHHGLSANEKNFFYLIEFDSRVTDIREQFPLLPISLAMQHAQDLGIKYPTIPKTETPCVLTTDFVITYADSGKTKYAAFSVKPKKGLTTKRDFEKQELERIWWEGLDIPWKIFLNDEQDKIIANNIRWLSQPLRDGNQKARSDLDAILAAIEPGTYNIDYLFTSLAQITGLSTSESSECFRTLVWNHLIDLDVEDNLLKTGILHIRSRANLQTKVAIYGTYDR